MISNLTVIHIEPSSNKLPSFPAELYWGTLPFAGGAGYTVNPEGIERWENWNTEFFDLHDITGEYLRTYGCHPSVVCNAIKNDLSGRTVYSEEPQDTVRLLKELFSAADIQQCELFVLDIEEQFLSVISTKTRLAGDASTVLAQIKEKILEEQLVYSTGGAWKIPYYSEIWKQLYAKSLRLTTG